MPGIQSLRLGLTLSFVVLLCSSYQTVAAQTLQSSSNNETALNVAAAKPAIDEDIAPETKTVRPAEKAESTTTTAFRNVTSRIGIDPGQTVPLSLNDAIRRALENNNDIEVARDDVRFNETTLRSLEGIYDPVFTVTPTFTRQTGSQSGRSTNDFSLNAGFDQFLPAGGGRITPFFNNSRNGSFFNNSNGNQFGGTTTTTQTAVTNGSIFSSSLGISYTQPLFRNRSIDQTRRGIRVQRKRLEQSDADFRQRTIETITNVQRSYWDLVFALRDQQNRTDNLNLTKENLRRVEAQIEAGSAAQLARAEVATELANREGEVLSAVENVTRAENTFKQLILKDPSAPEWQTAIIPTDTPSFDAPTVSLEDALAEAKTNRPELKRLNLQNEINNIDREFFRNQIKPQIDLVSSFSLNGFSQSQLGNPSGGRFQLISTDPSVRDFNADAYLLNQLNATRSALNLTPVNPPFVNVSNTNNSNVGGYNTAFGNLFNSNSPTFSVGVSIGFPLRNKTAKADLAGAEIQRNQIAAQTRAREQLVVAEVRNAVQAVETARQRIVSARTARENAEIQLQGEQKLYDVGRSTTFLLFQRQNTLANARNAEIGAQTDYNKALAELQRVTSTTLTVNNVIIDGAIIQ